MTGTAGTPRSGGNVPAVVAPVWQQLPKAVRPVRTAGEAAADPNDGDRLGRTGMRDNAGVACWPCAGATAAEGTAPLPPIAASMNAAMSSNDGCSNGSDIGNCMPSRSLYQACNATTRRESSPCSNNDRSSAMPVVSSTSSAPRCNNASSKRRRSAPCAVSQAPPDDAARPDSANSAMPAANSPARKRCASL